MQQENLDANQESLVMTQPCLLSSLIICRHLSNSQSRWAIVQQTVAVVFFSFDNCVWMSFVVFVDYGRRWPGDTRIK